MKSLVGPFLKAKDAKRTRNDVITFGGEDCDIHWDMQEGIDGIIRKCPWKPDVVIIWSPEYNPIPSGFEKIPALKVAVVGDWNLGFTMLKLCLGCFDLLLTDTLGVEVLSGLGAKVEWFPCFTFSGKQKFPDMEKDIDILFIGNMNPDVQFERSKWIFRVGMLARKYKVFIGRNIYGDEYKKIMARAKIVFNRSIRGEMNMRVFEALASRSLLFMEESNLEIRKFFIDKEHCVLYNDDNFEELLSFYLENEKERERIVERGYEKLKEVLEKSPLDRVIEIVRRTIGSIELSSSHNVDLLAHRILSFSNFPNLIGIVESINIDGESPYYLNLKGVLNGFRAEFLKSREDMRLSVELFFEASKKRPDWAVPRFNLAKTLMKIGEFKVARKYLIELVNLLNTRGSRALEPPWVFLTPYYDFFRTELERSQWNSSDSNSLAKLVMATSLEMLGDITEGIAAQKFYESSVILKPENPHVRYKLASALVELGKVEEAISEFEKVYRDFPLHALEFGYFRSYLKALAILSRKERLEDFMSEIRTFLRAAPQFGEKLKRL